MTIDEQQQRARAMAKQKISPELAELIAEHAKQRSLLDARHQNERADLAIAQEKRFNELRAKEAAAEAAAAKPEGP